MCFEYCHDYDLIYYRLSEHFYAQKIDFLYHVVPASLGVAGPVFNFGQACQLLRQVADPLLTEVSCILFLLKYFETVLKLDSQAGGTLADVREIQFECNAGSTGSKNN